MVAFAYMKDPMYYGKFKHIDVKYYYVCEMVRQKEVVLEHIFMSYMIADPLTKHINKYVFLTYVWSLGLR